ncbi:LytR family transcriptional regulator [Nocardioides dongxiaopingii]|uniref:LCP family protein n=1 Tax=Nocardioides sp. S-1144 TaxID=2582905 RepID=UPI00110DB0BC|nr:LCP family protein [Nocardioides sp. S-1144]QCW50250.1 LytR family transcriptional regulator [Nocardioides sp. S-1144]
MSPVSERAAQVRFRRALSLMAMTLVAPGSAQLIAGNRRVGLIAFCSAAGLLVTAVLGGLLALVHRPFAYWVATSPPALFWIYLVLTAAAVGWAALFIDAWRIGEPLSYSMTHRRMAVGVNGLLCFSVAGTLLVGAHLVGVQRDFMNATFGDGEASGAHHGRYNVLIMGGDAGAGRWGLRPDSMTVASVDAETGKTVLIGLPRNMSHFPFREGSVMDEQFPDGFDCDGCMLNGVSTWAEDNTELFGKAEDPGVDATIMAIEGITDLKINYWAMVNLEGFKDLVDAVGGVTLNVRQEIPIGLPGDKVTGTIEPGTRKLDGFETLWYARARDGSDDYSRMARQKCVMNAMLEQISPQSALRNFQRIAKASSEMVSTNLPSSEVDRFLDLAMKAKGQKLATLSLVPPMIATADPDIDLVHAKVAEAIDRAEGRAPATSDDGAKKPSRKKESTSVTGGSVGSLKEGYAANDSEDLGAAC